MFVPSRITANIAFWSRAPWANQPHNRRDRRKKFLIFSNILGRYQRNYTFVGFFHPLLLSSALSRNRTKSYFLKKKSLNCALIFFSGFNFIIFSDEMKKLGVFFWNIVSHLKGTNLIGKRSVWYKRLCARKNDDVNSMIANLRAFTRYI